MNQNTIKADTDTDTDTDTGNARCYTFSLTPSGQALLDLVPITTQERVRRLLAKLSIEEVEVLIGLLHKMGRQLALVNAVKP